MNNWLDRVLCGMAACALLGCQDRQPATSAATPALAKPAQTTSCGHETKNAPSVFLPRLFAPAGSKSKRGKAAMPPALRAAFIRATQESAPARFAWTGEAGALSASNGRARFALRQGELAMSATAGTRWNVELATRAIGRDGAMHGLGRASVQQDGRRNAARAHYAGVTERWTHGPLGVEHAYDIASKPAGDGALVIELEITGLQAVLENDAAVALADAGGAVRARYGQLFVHDAADHALSAHFEVSRDGSRLRLHIADHEATYPIAVDPLLTGEEATLTVAGSAVESQLASAVALSADGTRAIVGAPFDDTAAGADAGSARVFLRSGSSWVAEATLLASSAASGDNFGVSVALSSDGSRAIVGADFDDTAGGVDAGSARVFVRSGTTWTEEATLLASGAASGDSFGVSVALTADASRAIVGAVLDDTAGGTDAGSARVFVRSGTSWSEESSLLASGAATRDYFGYSVALASDGSRALIGAVLDDTAAGTDAGSARVFVRSGTSWSEESSLLLSAAAANDLFGWAVALSSDGSRALVGALNADTAGGTDSGSAQVFVRSGSSWSTEVTLQPSGASSTDLFGYAVALSSDGSRAVVGDYMDDTVGGVDAGSARVFLRSGTTWSEEATLLASGAAADDVFGGAVALSSDGSRALIGAPYDDTSAGVDAGSAHVFDRSGSSWSEQATLLAPGAASNDSFGYAVSLSSDGTRALVGAPYADTLAGTDAGSAHVFLRSGSTWSEEATLLASNAAGQDYFGYAVALSGDGTRALIGAPFDDTTAGSDAGSARAFLRSGSTWNEQAVLTASDGAAGDSLGFSVALSSDGSRALVGVPYDDTAFGTDAGSARVFLRSGTTWSAEATLSAATTSLGYSVSLAADGSRALLGALTDSSAANGAGGARVFARSGTTWSAEATLLASDAVAADLYGSAVALSGDGSHALIGAPYDDNGSATAAGSARAFVRSGSSWTFEATLLAAGASTDDHLGDSLALSSDGSRALLGAYYDDTAAGVDVGSARMFLRYGGVWSEQATLLASDAAAYDYLGYAVALSSDGSRALVGTYGDDTAAAMNTGTARVFTLTASGGCSLGSDCASGFCVDGVCCNNACGGGAADCQACSIAAGGAVDGTCGPLTAAIAPTLTCRASAGVCDHAEVCSNGSTTCPANTFASNGTQCRASTGVCDPAEVCTGSSATCPPDALSAAGTQCSPPSCSNGTATLAATCTGSSATCPAPTTQTCGQYVCGGTACGTTCSSDTQCASSGFCNASQCSVDYASGHSCTRNAECGTNACVNSLCTQSGGGGSAVPAQDGRAALLLAALLLLIGTRARTRRKARA